MSEEKKSEQVYTMEEVRQHKGAKSLWMVIHDEVYDISKFLEEHPGGEEVLLEQGGSYATEAFEDVGHSSDARELMADFHIGSLADADRETISAKPNTTPTAPTVETGGSLTTWLIPLGIAIAAALVYRFILAPSN